jgi:hypothetical protein
VTFEAISNINRTNFIWIALKRTGAQLLGESEH